jgi:large subunit ribosomal protein L31
MKKDLHPTYFPSAKVVCACGNSFTVGSTREKIEVEICSACHPFYTGNEKLLDTAGRVEKFKARQAAKKPSTSKKASKASSESLSGTAL